MKKTLILIILLLVVVGAAFAAGRFTSPVKVETVEIPGEYRDRIVYVDRVKEIEIEGPGRVIERIDWKTKIVPVDREVMVNVCPGGDPEEDYAPDAFVAVEADKFFGEVDGTLKTGWVGEASCLFRRNPQTVWATLATAPIDLTQSVAVSTVDPETIDDVLHGALELRAGLTSRPGASAGASWYRQGRRWGLWVQADYDTDPANWRDGSQVIDTDGAWAASAGISRRFGKK